MAQKVNNATQPPRRYYGMHFSEGVAEYRPEDAEPYRVLLRESVIKKMDNSFSGRPLVVLHTDKDLKDMLPNLMEVADGFVVKSFYNPADGKHWCEFLVTTDEGHQAVQKKWSLSNCYKINRVGAGGQWHGVDYINEVEDATYEHLALVPNPRYESMILTPEEFQEYNRKKELENQKLANAGDNNKEETSMFNFFKKAKIEKVENSKEIEATFVTLPESKLEISVGDGLKQLDELLMAKKANKADLDAEVTIGEETLKVSQLVELYEQSMKNEKDEDKEEKEEEKKENEDEEEEEEEEEEKPKNKKKNKKKNADDSEEKPEDKKEEKTFEGLEHFKDLKNAHKNASEEEPEEIELAQTQIQRGQARYGS